MKTNIDAVVAANRRTAEEGVVTLQRELARERQARQEADVVLEQTTLVRRPRPGGPVHCPPAAPRLVSLLHGAGEGATRASARAIGHPGRLRDRFAAGA